MNTGKQMKQESEIKLLQGNRSNL